MTQIVFNTLTAVYEAALGYVMCCKYIVVEMASYLWWETHSDYAIDDTNFMPDIPEKQYHFTFTSIETASF